MILSQWIHAGFYTTNSWQFLVVYQCASTNWLGRWPRDGADGCGGGDGALSSCAGMRARHLRGNWCNSPQCVQSAVVRKRSDGLRDHLISFGTPSMDRKRQLIPIDPALAEPSLERLHHSLGHVNQTHALTMLWHYRPQTNFNGESIMSILQFHGRSSAASKMKLEQDDDVGEDEWQHAH